MKKFKYLITLLVMMPALTLFAARSQPEMSTSYIDPSAVSDLKSDDIWYDDLNAASGAALNQYKPIMIFFSSSDCPWSRKLKDEVMKTPEVKAALKNFIPVRLDIDNNIKLAQRYGVRGSPTLVFLASDLSYIGICRGFLRSDPLAKLMNRMTTANSDAIEKKMEKLLTELNAKKVTGKSLAEAMLALGWNRDCRKKITAAINAMKVFPAKELIELLTSKKLAVRLGALELLEERSGDSFGFDPWYNTSPGTGQLAALEKWRLWLKDKKHKTSASTTVLSRERYNVIIQNALSQNRDRSSRAMLLLKNGGQGVLAAITAFLDTHPNLPTGSKLRLKEIEYATILTNIGMPDALSQAHRLIFGNQNMKLQSIISLGQNGEQVLPILSDFIKSDQPIIRETTVDALVEAGKKQSVPILEKHLKIEKNDDVVFAIIRNLGEVKSLRSAAILEKYLDNSNEDLVIAALESLTDLGSQKSGTKITKCLDDPRWRIQVAALKAITKLKVSKADKKIIKLLSSKDEFVRINAIGAIAGLRITNAQTVLKKVFMEHDDLKGQVIAAYASMKLPIPKSFIDQLKKQDANSLFPVLQAVDDMEDQGFEIANMLANHSDPDVSSQAANLLAGMSKAPNRRFIAFQEILSGNNKNKILAMLKNFNISEKQLSNLQSAETPEKETKSNNKQLDTLFDAFGEKQPEKPRKQVKKIAMDNLMGAFGADQPAKESNSEASPEAIRKAYDQFVATVKKLSSDSKDEDMRLYSSLVLLKLNKPGGYDYFCKIFPSLTVEKKTRILNNLRSGKKHTPARLKLLKLALEDANKNVSKEATALLMEDGGKSLEYFFNLLNTPGTKLKLYNLINDRAGYSLNSSKNSYFLKKWSYKTLDNKDSVRDMRIMALFFLKRSPSGKSDKYLERYIKSNDIMLKRAALYSLGRSNLSKFQKYIPELLKSKHNRLRELIPEIVFKSKISHSNIEIIYFDDKHIIDLNLGWDYRNSGKSMYFDDDYVAALKKMTNDISPKLRIDAYFALMQLSQKVAPAKLISVIKLVQDKRIVSSRIGNYLTNNAVLLGMEFKPLLNYVDKEEMSTYQYEKIRKHFSPEKRTVAAKPVVGKKLKLRVEAAPKLEVKNTVAEAPPVKRKIKLVYFYKNGCQECEKVKQDLDILKSSFPELTVEQHNMFHVESMKLNEAYCEKYKVPAKIRLVAPAVFMADGYLIKNEVNFDRLGRLIANSAASDNRNWYIVDKTELKRSEKRITGRYSHITTAFVLLAGLNDGVNPCAFATIIFFISYMVISRRKKSEILQVSIAFIAGVFVAYYLMGMGLAELVIRLELVKDFGRIINRIMMVIVFIIMVMSIYDGILCLKGRIEDIKLQLPEKLKEKIRSSVRIGAKKRHFIIAAFITGLVISILELACTGQVYLPTIMYMLKTGADSFQAYLLLAIYNLAFILPLIVIFAFTWLGMKNSTLINFFKANAAWVKFSTALLFLVLLILLAVDIY